MAEPTKTTTDEKPPPLATKPPDPPVADDSDPDFDDLDDVLDQFSASTNPVAAPAPAQLSSEPAPAASGPGRPIEVPHGQDAKETDEDFMARLTAEMEAVMSKMAAEPLASSSTPDDIAKMGKELEEFTLKMEAEGVKPEDLLKAILGQTEGERVTDAAKEERDRRASQSEEVRPAKIGSDSSARKSRDIPSSPPTAASTNQSSKPNFEDTIRRTMARMETSSTSADASKSAGGSGSEEEDMIATLLKSIEGSSSGGDGADGDLSQLFLGMMEQLTHKDMLYEPMKELHDRYPAWLTSHQATLPTADFQRYSKQQTIVAEIVGKFEDRRYSDNDPACREYIWERMQLMQAEGAPPEELVSNPFPGMGAAGLPDLSAFTGLAGGAGAGAGLDADGDDVGCPTQ